jgi:NAD(P)-dependent dehydrogenase (short-subunit alcohol dehydrogenase family)
MVMIASTRALMSEPNTESYSASKGGLVALTHALAISLGPDVRVNCVSPGCSAANQ